MLPIDANDAYRNSDGSLSKMKDVLGGDSELPEYTSSDAGKSLQVGDDGVLLWGETASGTKIYYKDFTTGVQNIKQIASYADGGASGSGIYVAQLKNPPSFDVTGYRYVGHILQDINTGYRFGALAQFGYYSNADHIEFQLIFSSRAQVDGFKIRIFYVKISDSEVIS